MAPLTKTRKNGLLFGLALVWTVGWGIRVAVEWSDDELGWALYSALLFCAGIGWAVTRLRRLREAPGADE